MGVVHLDAWRAWVILRQCLADLAARETTTEAAQQQLASAQQALYDLRGEQPSDASSPAPDTLVDAEQDAVALIRTLVDVDDPDTEDPVAAQCQQAVDLLG